MTGTLLTAFARIAQDTQPVDDPTGEILTTRLSPVLDPTTAQELVRIVYGTAEYTTALDGLPDNQQFPPSVGRKIGFDKAKALLRYTGAMTPAEKADLEASAFVNTLPVATRPKYLAAVDELFKQPATFMQEKLRALLDPVEAEPILRNVPSLDAQGKPVLVDAQGNPLTTGGTQAAVTAIAMKSAYLLQQLRRVLSQNLIKQTLSDAFKLDTATVALLLEHAPVLHALSDATAPTMRDFLFLSGDGLRGTYFNSEDLSGTPVLERLDGSVDFAWGTNAPATGVNPDSFSVRWVGKVFVETSEEYTFSVRASDGVRLTLDGNVLIDEWRTQPVQEFKAVRKLEAGRFYDLVLEYFEHDNEAVAQLRWSSPAKPQSVIPPQQLYSPQRVQEILARVERLYKVGLIITTATLSASEVAFLVTRKYLDLNALPMVLMTPAQAKPLFEQWLRVQDYVTLRSKLPAVKRTLLDVLSAPSPEAAIDRFVQLSGWQVADLRALYTGFTFERFNPQTMTWDAPQLPDLRDDRWWLRLVQCHALVRRTGASPRQLFEWARVKHENKTPTGPVFLRYTMTAADAVSAAEAQGVAQDVKNVVKAKYNDEQWPVVAKSLNDTLRAKQKAALIAYILAMPRMQEQSITHSNQLFEYFLIDVEMDPCMQTSRIKQGIASVQLFIQRCLMNLEKQVSPAQIDEHRWRWMRRYRVWEANRKVFLYPENWIEPELRDDKSPFFKELESEVLQNELTEANAEKAFLHYLQKLDDVAKLDICGVCQDTENKVLHVFARTFTTPYVYYYRRLEQRAATSWAEGIWTPWEKVPVDIASVEDGENSGVHLIPVLWNRRLYLFWPIFAQKPNEEQNKKLPEGFDPLNDWEIKLAWSEYWQGKWSTKTESNAFVMSPCVVASILTNEKQPPKGKTDVGVFIYTTVFLGGVPPEPGLMRDGEKLNPNETAQFFSQETLNRIEYYLPTPKDHFFTVGYNNERLLISVHRRFSAEATGRETVKQYESVSIVRDGKGELRERTKENPPRNYPGAHVESFDSLRLFALESCNGKVTPLMWLVSGPYNAIVTPPDTQNTFMAFADIQAANFSLPDKQPLLQNKPSPFSVIDSDNRADFNPYNGFFYLDDACAYFVTSRVGSNDYFRPFTTPDVTTPKFSLPGLQRDYDLFRDLPYPQPLSPSINPIETNPWFLTSRRVFAPQTELAQMPGIDLAPLRPGVTLTPDRASDGKVRGVHQRAKISLIYQFHKHWHPHVCEFIRGLNRDGFAGLLTVKTQGLSNDVGGSNHFQQVYRPSRNVAFPYPSEVVDFRRSGAYSLYNWELFFHVPFLLATRLSRQQRFEEALRWFHYIFNPMDSGDDSPTPPEPAPQRYWKFLPFKAVDAQRIDELLGLLSYQGSDPDKLSEKQSLEAAIQEWAADPFKPHLIARTRHIAYMKSVFMKYVDTLIAWGDQLFRQDTIESINEATQLYVLAANLLGERPQRIPKHGNIQPETYDSLRKRKLDALANAMVELETRLPFAHLTPAKNGVTGQLASAAQTLYFCIPQNDKLLSYWDTVADRLFKIRHCMNIEGVVRQLPLFEPPIDPALLVQAVAMGLDLTSVLNDLYAPLPHYRFTYMLQKALELAAELRSLGSALLSTLEKKDAEALAKLRARHETEMLNLVKEVKKKQKEETQANLTALRRTRAVADVRYQHYQKLLGAQTVSAPPENSAVPLLSNDANKIAEDSSTYKLIESERQHLERLERANERQEDATYIEVAAGLSHLLPNITIKKGIFEWTFGGSNIGSALGAWARYVSHLAADYTHQANRASIIGGVERRMEDWVLQSNLAAKEIEQIDKQIIAARIREDIAQKELTNHDEQLTRAQKIEEFLRSTKYTNEDLYVWMEGRIAEVYFQCYEMTHDFVKRTEQAFRFVLGVTTSNYIKFDYWDSLKKGLMVGESLYLALKQMENAYHDQNKREYEITKHVSLLQLDPLALIQLKETGQCEIELPEVLFDLDFPGHYFRRIKSVSITIPCVVGPYSSVNCTLTLLSNRTRVNSVVTDAYSETPDGNDGRFVRDFAAMQSIATSHAQNDSGMFELNFRDERYLPFEGAGAISRWRIELPREFRQFDYDTISDVVLHLKYTARDGGKALADAALEEMRADLNTLMTTARNGEGFVRLFSARHEFPNEWYRFLNPTDLAAQQQILEFALEKDRFPLLFSNERFTITLRDIQLFLKLKGGFSYEDTATLVFNKDSNPQSPPKFTITDSPIGTEDSKLPFAIFPGISDQSPLPQQLKLEVRSTDLPIPSTASETSWWKVVQVNNQNQSRLKAEAFEDIFVVCHYSVAPKQ
jgi:hypothetical protein